MTSNTVLKISFLLLLLAQAGCEKEAGTAKTISFAEDVQPILDGHCVECHDKSAEGVAVSGLNLSDYDGVMMGTRLGPMVIPNSSESSSLYLVIAEKTSPEIQMPPQHPVSLAEGRGMPLSAQQVATIKDWIDQGAVNN